MNLISKLKFKNPLKRKKKVQLGLAKKKATIKDMLQALPIPRRYIQFSALFISFNLFAAAIGDRATIGGTALTILSMGLFVSPIFYSVVKLIFKDEYKPIKEPRIKRD